MAHIQFQNHNEEETDYLDFGKALKAIDLKKLNLGFVEREYSYDSHTYLVVEGVMTMSRSQEFDESQFDESRRSILINASYFTSIIDELENGITESFGSVPDNVAECIRELKSTLIESGEEILNLCSCVAHVSTWGGEIEIGYTNTALLNIMQTRRSLNGEILLVHLKAALFMIYSSCLHPRQKFLLWQSAMMRMRPTHYQPVLTWIVIYILHLSTNAILSLNRPSTH